MEEEQKTFTNRDPKAGCAIMVIGVIVFGGLIAYAVSMPFKQSKLMREFTETAPAKLSYDPKGERSSLQALTEKLQSFSARLNEADAVTEISLSTKELNAAIQHYEEFEELLGKMEVEEITNEEVLFKISFPLRAAPFSDEVPYLNGVMHTVPKVLNDEIVLETSKITVPQGEVPEGFLSHFRPYRIMAKYSEHEYLGRVMFACEEIVLGKEMITLRVNPEKYRDPLAIEAEDGGEGRKQKRSIVMTVSSFLLVGGLFLFLVRRRNALSAKAMREMR